MDKKDRMYYAMGIIRAYVECDKNWKTVPLGNIIDEEYEDYVIGVSGTNDEKITLFDVSSDDGKRRRVIEVTCDFKVDQVVHLLLEALSYDKERKKNEKK